MGWPPKIGEALPRAGEAWCVEEKWANWILAADGHALEWGDVFEVDPGDWVSVWKTIAAAVIDAPVDTVRNPDSGGVTCGVPIELTIGARTAPVISAWHYANASGAPRLVTAYPRLYNRDHGNNA